MTHATTAFQLQLLAAMAATEAPGRCFWSDPAVDSVLREGERRGFLTRRSTTQVHWSKKGMAALDQEVVDTFRAEQAIERAEKAAIERTRRERLGARMKADALKVFADSRLKKVARQAKTAARLAAARAQIETGEPEAFEPFLRGTGREIWVEVEGISFPSPFKSKKAARVAVLRMLDGWQLDLSLAHNLPLVRKRGSPCRVRQESCAV